MGWIRVQPDVGYGRELASIRLADFGCDAKLCQCCGMQLYTILLDYAGGTYVAQTTAASEQAAVRNWLERLSLDLIAGAVSREVASAFQEDVDVPVSLDGLASAWCVTAIADQGLALVNIVKTAA